MISPNLDCNYVTMTFLIPLETDRSKIEKINL